MAQPEEQSVETHFGTSHSGGFHVVGTFDDGNIQFLDTQCNLLFSNENEGMASGCRSMRSVWIHTVATIGDGAPAASFVNGGQFDVLLQVADTADATKHADYPSVHGGRGK